ncbi:hypothetical protein U9M48_040820 [Paspalum notatum var. saurae]|uniref:Uncharacterized protein n=1 Tax=Paspalum notatum var. saurae TaxID=547442 RepID=A0AAQ3UMI1_PASNO
MDARALFLAATIVMAMVLSPLPAQAGRQENCYGLLGGQCNQDTCTKVCKANGYVDPRAECNGSGECCCWVLGQAEKTIQVYTPVAWERPPVARPRSDGSYRLTTGREAHLADAEYINTYIHSFWPMCDLFARGVFPDMQKRRNRRLGIADQRGEVIRGASEVGSGGGGNVSFLDDDDDDFMPVCGQANTQPAQGARRRSTSRHAAVSSRRSNEIFLDDDDDDFVPVRAQTAKPSAIGGVTLPRGASSSSSATGRLQHRCKFTFLPLLPLFCLLSPHPAGNVVEPVAPRPGDWGAGSVERGYRPVVGRLGRGEVWAVGWGTYRPAARRLGPRPAAGGQGFYRPMAGRQAYRPKIYKWKSRATGEPGWLDLARATNQTENLGLVLRSSTDGRCRPAAPPVLPPPSPISSPPQPLRLLARPRATPRPPRKRARRNHATSLPRPSRPSPRLPLCPPPPLRSPLQRAPTTRTAPPAPYPLLI